MVAPIEKIVFVLLAAGLFGLAAIGFARIARVVRRGRPQAGRTTWWGALPPP